MDPVTELVPPPRPWAALPRDLVGEISVRLRDAADFVRLHAICRPWRKAAPSPAAIRARFLPWPLALCNDLFLHLPVNFGCISPWTTSRYHECDGVLLQPPGTASASGDMNNCARFLRLRPEPTMVDLLNGAIRVLPQFPEYGYRDINRRMKKFSRGIVYSDGTIFVYNNDCRYDFMAAILRPGNMAWIIAEKRHSFEAVCDVSAAYHDGKILVCMRLKFWFVLTLDFQGNGRAGGGRLEMKTDRSGGAMKHEYSYVFELGNELMWATVMSEQSQNYGCTGYGPENTLSLTLHALVGADIGGKMRWVARDARA